MKKKTIIKLITGTTIIAGAISVFMYLRKKKKAVLFSEIKENCIKENTSILDDHGGAPAVDADDVIVEGDGHNCLAKKALYDFVHDKRCDWDIKILTEFVKSNCSNCKRKGSHGYNIGG